MAEKVQRMSEADLLEVLSNSLAKEAASAAFTCGGSTAIGDIKTPSSPQSGQKRKPNVEDPEAEYNKPSNVGAVGPVCIRWDSVGLNAGAKITFPLQTGSDRTVLGQLVSDCQPATFGRGRNDVLDETYRKAGKLDEDAFCTNFCPSDAGILDVIAQVLLPTVAEDSQLRRVRAELYKLNVSVRRHHLRKE